MVNNRARKRINRFVILTGYCKKKIRIHKKLQEYIKKAHFPLATKKDFYRDV